MIVAKNSWQAAFGVAAIVALTLAVPAWARGPLRGRFSTPHAAPRAPGLLTQLIFPCRAACVNTARDCDDSADSEALTCISDACTTEVETAQTACGTDRTSEACHDAVSALQTCSESCLTTRQSALSDCREALATCRAACATE
jgi:hypothetical protein